MAERRIFPSNLKRTWTKELNRNGMNGELKASIFYFWSDQEEECAGDEDVKGPIFTLSRTPSTFFVPPAFFRGHSSSTNVFAFSSLKI
jgi:hypothetical protein